MSEENFTQKDILLQVMSDVRETRKEIGDQRVLLTRHIEASATRDIVIQDIKTDVDALKMQVGVLERFQVKLMAVWGAAWSLITLLAVYLLDKFILR